MPGFAFGPSGADAASKVLMDVGAEKMFRHTERVVHQRGAWSLGVTEGWEHSYRAKAGAGERSS